MPKGAVMIGCQKYLHTRKYLNIGRDHDSQVSELEGEHGFHHGPQAGAVGIGGDFVVGEGPGHITE